ncbi:MAG: hypothetical protein WB392_06080, partial [Methanotrichaceae archaeon]
MEISSCSFRLLLYIASALALSSLVVMGAMALNANNSQLQNQPPAVSQEILWNFIQAGDSLSTNLTKIDEALTNASLALSNAGLQGPK